jgi:hypothetical protein
VFKHNQEPTSKAAARWLAPLTAVAPLQGEGNGRLRRSSFGIDKDSHFKNVYPLATLSPMKDVGLRIRVQRELREQFLEACQAEDKPAAQVLREFMRSYVNARTRSSVNDASKSSNNQMKRG